MKLIIFMIFKNLRQYFFSSLLAILSISISFAMLISIISLKEQTHENFTMIGHGVDAILGPKGSPLQIVLNAIYNIEEMPGKIKWEYYKKVKNHPIVEIAIPFCTGHSFSGFRVNAISEEFFTDFEYQPNQKFSFDPNLGGTGRMFKERDEAVIGNYVAKTLNLGINSIFSPVCGVSINDPIHDDKIKIVGIFAKTGTPYDRVIYIPLKTFYTLSGHGEDVAKMSLDEKFREISGAYIKIKKIRNGIIHPQIQELKYNINQSPNAQLVIPNEVLPKLFNIIGWIDYVLITITIVISILSVLFLFTILFNAINQRKRDIALIRFLGASRKLLFSVVIGESLTITLFGIILGFIIGHFIIYISSIYIHFETGVHFSTLYISNKELILIPIVFLISFLAGLIPAINAYQIDIIKGLSPIS